MSLLLIIGISRNSGGMTDNVHKTLNYFTEKSVDTNCTFSLTAGSRDKIKTVLPNKSCGLWGLSEEQHQQLVAYVDSVPAGSYFTTDSSD